MSIQWGSWSSNNRLRCGISVSQSPSTVDENTTFVTLTIKVYLQTRYASDEYDGDNSPDNWYVAGDVSYSNQTDWNMGAMDYKLMGTVTHYVNTSTSSSVTTDYYGYVISRHAYSGTKATSPTIHWTTAQRPTPAPPPDSNPPDSPPPPPPPPPGEGGWCLYAHTDVSGLTDGLTLSCQWQPNDLPTIDKAILMMWNGYTVKVDKNGALTAFGWKVTEDGVIVPGRNYRISASASTAAGIALVVNDQSWTLGWNTNPMARDEAENDIFAVGGLPDGDYSRSMAATGRFSHTGGWTRALSVDEMLAFFGDTICAPGLKADQRMATLLNYANWPSAKRIFDPALDTLNRESWSDNTSVMSLLQKWAQDDGGIVYADASGNIVFQNRHSRVNSPIDFTLDFDTPNAPEAGLSFVMDENDIINVVNLDVKYGVKAALRDTASVAAYGERPQGLTLDIQDSNVGVDAARSMLLHYADPIIRVDGLEIFPSAAEGSTLWEIALGAEIGSVIRLTNLPPTAPDTTMDFYIESINHTVARDGDRLKWRTKFSISPYFADEGWVLDTSALDSTTKLAY